MKIKKIKLLSLSLLAFLLLANLPVSTHSQLRNIRAVQAQSGNRVFLPQITGANRSVPQPRDGRVINVPYFATTEPDIQMGIFWFGAVTPTENYADVRVGYTPTELQLHINVFDRQVWYNTGSGADVLATLTQYDAITLYLNTAGGSPRSPSSSAYRFEVQMNENFTHLPNHTRVSIGNGQSWQASNTAFTDQENWQGNAANNDDGDRGWLMIFHIPFSSLGLPQAPQPGTTWGLAMDLHDRDSASGPANPVKTWPAPNETGYLNFGIPAYTPLQVSSLSAPVSVRHGINGADVKNAMVGGGYLCGAETDYWTTWGTANYYGKKDFNVQNQYNVADFPCFSRAYLTFPLPQIPAGKVLVSARLTLHHWGNSDVANAHDSYIQVMRVAEDWDPATITWNNAPLALENYAGAWVQPDRDNSVNWPGTPYDFDMSRAVADAYREGQPLRLAVYSADSDLHSGKYFVSSYAEDWNAAGRPVIEIVFGTP
jgi:hypothetical protein